MFFRLRAYEELEKDGIIFSTVGKASFVAGKQLGITTEEIKEMILIYAEEGEFELKNINISIPKATSLDL